MHLALLRELRQVFGDARLQNDMLDQFRVQLVARQEGIHLRLILHIGDCRVQFFIELNEHAPVAIQQSRIHGLRVQCLIR